MCHGSGWELHEVEVPGYGKAHPFAKPCAACKNTRRFNDTTGIPSKYYEADISKFCFESYSKDITNLKKLIQQYYNKFRECEKRGKGIYFWSKTPGSGKTFLSCCLGKSIMLRYDLSMRFITVPDYLVMVGESYKREAGERDESLVYRECDLLIFDDIGSQKKGEWQTQEIFRLINERMNNGKVTIYTSNLEPEELNVDERTIDRIIKSCLVISMPEESIRRKQADEEQQAFLQSLLVE